MRYVALLLALAATTGTAQAAVPAQEARQAANWYGYHNTNVLQLALDYVVIGCRPGWCHLVEDTPPEDADQFVPTDEYVHVYRRGSRLCVGTHRWSPACVTDAHLARARGQFYTEAEPLTSP